MKRFAVVEIDVGTDYYESYSGIRCLGMFESEEEAQQYKRKQEESRKVDYNGYLRAVVEMAEKILADDPEARIVKKSTNPSFPERTVNTIAYYLRSCPEDYPEYDIPEKPLFPSQFELDIVDINLQGETIGS